MKGRYVLTKQAEEDLAAIAEYIRDESSAAMAERVVLELQRAFRLIAEQPGIGHAREELSPEPRIRFWSVFAYLVAFVPDQTPLPIVAIVHGSREPNAIVEMLRSAIREQRA